MFWIFYSHCWKYMFTRWNWYLIILLAIEMILFLTWSKAFQLNFGAVTYQSKKFWGGNSHHIHHSFFETATTKVQTMIFLIFEISPWYIKISVILKINLSATFDFLFYFYMHLLMKQKVGTLISFHIAISSFSFWVEIACTTSFRPENRKVVSPLRLRFWFHSLGRFDIWLGFGVLYRVLYTYRARPNPYGLRFWYMIGKGCANFFELENLWVIISRLDLRRMLALDRIFWKTSSCSFFFFYLAYRKDAWVWSQDWDWSLWESLNWEGFLWFAVGMGAVFLAESNRYSDIFRCWGKLDMQSPFHIILKIVEIEREMEICFIYCTLPHLDNLFGW